jgi:hypothetical protein
MLALRPSRRRPPLSAPRGQLRAAWRLAVGFSPAAVARAEAVTEQQIETLLAQPDFQELVEAVAEFRDLPEEQRLLQLEQMAWCVLELALADSDWRAAAFITDQIRRGFNPARILAQGVTKAQARATAPEPERVAEPATPPPPRPYRPYDAVGAAIGRATASMRVALAAETVLGTSAPPSTASEPSPPVRPRRPDTSATRMRIDRGARPVAPAEHDPRKPPRSWAQGP